MAGLHLDQVILSHNSVFIHSKRQNAARRARAGGEGGLVNRLSVFNSLHNGLWLSSLSICLDLMFYGPILIVSAVKPGESEAARAKADLTPVYFMSSQWKSKF